MRRQSGLTLIELMLAMTLGLLLISVMLEMYLASQRSYRLQMALSLIQENAKTVIDSLTSDIRKAGYIGCAQLTTDFPAIFYVPYSITPHNKLTGNDAELIVRYVEPNGIVLKESMVDDTTLYTSSERHLSVGDRVVISDCGHAELFQIEEIVLSGGRQMIIPTHPLQHRYKQDAEIGRLVINHYFIAKTKQGDNDGTEELSLFVEDIKHHKTELVAGINRMKFLYSIHRQEKLIDVSAKDISDWSNVIGIAIELELASPPLKKTWQAYVSLRE